MTWSRRLAFLSLLLIGPIACNPSSESGTSVDPAPEPLNSASASATDNDTAVADEASQVDVEIADLAMLREHIQKFPGKQVVVDIWSTSCAPCMHEFPNLVDLSEKYPEQVACISFNVDYIGLKSKTPESYVPKVEEFLQKQNATDVTNLVSSTADEQVLTQYELESIPAILIFDRQGELAHKLTDANSGDDGLSYVGDVIPKLQLVDDVTNE